MGSNPIARSKVCQDINNFQSTRTKGASPFLASEAPRKHGWPSSNNNYWTAAGLGSNDRLGIDGARGVPRFSARRINPRARAGARIRVDQRLTALFWINQKGNGRLAPVQLA